MRDSGSRQQTATPRWRRWAAWAATAVVFCSSAGCVVQRGWAPPPGSPGDPPVEYASPAVDIIGTLLWMMGTLIIHEAVSSAVSVGADPDPVSAMRYWEDPDDWLVDCPGPLDCPPYQVMTCWGGPDRCRCSCEFDAERAAAR